MTTPKEAEQLRRLGERLRMKWAREEPRLSETLDSVIMEIRWLEKGLDCDEREALWDQLKHGAER